jgi:hypothetical protein
MFLMMIFTILFWIPAAVLFGISFAVLYTGKGLLKIGSEDITNEKNSFLYIVITEWIHNCAALFVSLIVMFLIASNIPLFEGLQSEYGIASSNAYIPALIYLCGMALLHAGFFSLSYFYIKKAIKNNAKRIRLFIPLAVISPIIWAGVFCFLISVWDR